MHLLKDLLTESKLSDYNKDNFPFEKWFTHEDAYFYPYDFDEDGDIDGVYAEFRQGENGEDEIEIGVADIEKADLGLWDEIDVDEIPKAIVDEMMKDFDEFPGNKKEKDND